MSYIKIPVPLVLIIIIGGTIAAIVAQLPEIQRYLKVKAM
jgi:uncharacterized protein DUF6893